jgi:hypothetical protein
MPLKGERETGSGEERPRGAAVMAAILLAVLLLGVVPVVALSRARNPVWIGRVGILGPSVRFGRTAPGVRWSVSLGGMFWIVGR